MNWRKTLQHLEQKLKNLEQDGIQYLNVETDLDLLTHLVAAGEQSLKMDFPPPSPSPKKAAPLHSGTVPTSTAPSGRADPTQPVASGASPRPNPAPQAPPPVTPGVGPVADLPGISAPVNPVKTLKSPLSEGPLEEIATLESLQFRFRNCTACPLGATRNRLVFGTGAFQPKILFLGEGPGAEEDQQGLPFVGRAGALLTGLIQALGLTRADVYITNVVKCRPPENKDPGAAEIKACTPVFTRQIELLAPQLIVTLGNVPLKTLKPNAGGITKERGQVFSWHGFDVLPTFHPSYLLRSPSALGDCWDDFSKAFSRAYGESP